MRKLVTANGLENTRATATSPAAKIGALRALPPMVAPDSTTSEADGWTALVGGSSRTPSATRTRAPWETRPRAEMIRPRAKQKRRPTPSARPPVAKPKPAPNEEPVQIKTGAVATSDGLLELRYENAQRLRAGLDAAIAARFHELAVLERARDSIDSGRKLGPCQLAPLHGPRRERLLDALLHDLPPVVRDELRAPRRDESDEWLQHGECAGLRYARMCIDCGTVVDACDVHGGTRGLAHRLEQHDTECEHAQRDTAEAARGSFSRRC
jgi:hypothetical protein